MLPPRKSRKPKLQFGSIPKRTKLPTRIECPEHARWVRGFACCVAGCQGLPIEAHHIRKGRGRRDDDRLVSLCRAHHREFHSIGVDTFERRYALDLVAVAKEFASRSPFKSKLQR